MKNDDFEIEELIIPVGDLDNYKSDELTLDFDQAEIEKLGINLDDIEEVARKYGIDAALEFIETLKENSTEKTVDEIDLIDDDDKSDTNSAGVVDLSTPSFVSPITGEEVRLDKMGVYDRIGEIYYHTGITVGVSDSIFVNGYNKGLNSFSNFLDSLPLEYANDFAVKLGKNWKEKLLQDWSAGWSQEVTKVVSNEKDKAADRLREDLKAEKIKSSQLGERVDVLSETLSNEQSKNAELATKVTTLEKSRDEALAQLRDARAALTQKQVDEYVPDFVTSEDRNVYDYIVSQGVPISSEAPAKK